MPALACILSAFEVKLENLALSILLEGSCTSPKAVLQHMLARLLQALASAKSKARALADSQASVSVLNKTLIFLRQCMGTCCRYCDAARQPTEQYPLNPNGSPDGIAALCSSDGRHLAIMPHPERCFLGWQLPWSPPDANIAADGPSPWLRLFQNALTWCQATAN